MIKSDFNIKRSITHNNNVFLKNLAVYLLKEKMPDFVPLVNWQSIKLDTVHIEQSSQQDTIEEQTQLTLLFEFVDGSNGKAAFRIEKQSDHDDMIAIHTTHQDTGRVFKGRIPSINESTNRA